MDFRLPELGEGVYEAELVGWLVKVGETIKPGQGLMEVMTDKATMEVPSPFSGKILSLHGEPGTQVKVGDVILTYGGAAEAVKEEPKPKAKVAPAKEKPVLAAVAASPSSGNARKTAGPLPVKAAPSVRYMARKLGLDLSQIEGSGAGGRILIDDVSAFVQRADGRKSEEKQAPRMDFGVPGTRIKLQGVRRKIAEHMVHSKQTAPHYAYVDECDVTDLVKLRESLRDVYAKAGVKLTYLAFVVKATAVALKEVPLVNSSLDEDAGEIVLHDQYHIGIAVAAPSGLIVPVIRDADKKNLGEIARDIERLSNDARTGKARLEDLRGDTFTVTSIGNIGGLFATPIINTPAVGILGIGKIVKRPIYDPAGNLKPADMLYLSFSFDHRVLDGAVGAAFGNAIIRQLQNPATLLPM